MSLKRIGRNNFVDALLRLRCSGLAVQDGRSVHLGTTAEELAAHAAHLLRSPDAARQTVDEAEAVLSEHYLLDVVAPMARRLLFG